MKFQCLAGILLGMLLVVLLTACGGGSSHGSNSGGGGGGGGTPLNITTSSLPGGTVGVAYSVTLQATGGTPPYTWSVSQGSLPSWATLNASTGAISGTPNAPGNATLTFRVTDSNNVTTQTNSLTLFIAPAPPPLTITTTSLPNGTVGTVYSANLQETGGTPPYTWSISGGSLPAWASLNASTGAITGTPNASGATNFTVQVTDSESPTVSATANLSINIAASTANLGLFSGQYAFVVSGFDSALGGSITVDGKGNITGGTEDIAAPATTLSGSGLTITSGTYTVGSDHRGTLSYTDSNGNKFTFAFALGAISSGVAAQGQMIEFDSNPLEMTGQLALQNTTVFSVSALNGPFVIEMPGWDANNQKPQVIVGSFTASSGALSSGLLDVNDGGNVTTAEAFTGSLSSVSSDGRASLTLNVGSVHSLAVYIVSASEWFVISGATAGQNFVVGGEVLQQSAGPFSNASLSGNTVITGQTDDNGAGPQAFLGLLAWSGSGTVSGSYDQNQDGTVTSNNSINGTYTFTNPTNGRFTLTPSSTRTLAGYMVAPNEAVFVEIASGQISGFNTIEPQSAGPFGNSSLNGSFYLGTLSLMSPRAPSSTALNITSGVMTFNGSGSLSSTLDINSSGTPTSGTTDSDTYSVASNGRMTTTSGDFVGYLVSPGKLYLLNIAQGQPDTRNPTIFILQQ